MTDLSSGAPRLASAGARFRAAVAAEKPLQIAGTNVWAGATGVGQLGTNATTCNDWTSNTGTVSLGSSSYATTSFFGTITAGCGGTAALYCVEP